MNRFAWVDPQIKHKDGIEWFDAPIPRRWHRCFVQTSGYSGLFTLIERCPCGAIRINGERWRRKNDRRKNA